jgi:hypothetical protein
MRWEEGVGDTRLERVAKNGGNTAKSPSSAAKSAALSDDGLDRVVEAWPTLSAGQRRAILQLVGQAG